MRYFVDGVTNIWFERKATRNGEEILLSKACV